MSGTYTVHYLISQGCEDEAAKYVSAVEKNGAVYAEPLEFADRSKVQSCVYITAYGSGVTEADIVAVTPDVASWLIVVSKINNRFDQDGFDVVKAKWEQSLSGMKIALKVISGAKGFERALAEWVDNEAKFAGSGHQVGEICLVTSQRPKTGKTSLIRLLEEKVNCGIVEMGMKEPDYETIRDKAATVVFVGEERNDFNLPAFNDCLRKSLFVLNKCDNRHIFLKNEEYTRLSVIEILGKNGWDMTPFHKTKIFLCSALYSGFYKGFANGDLGVDFFIEEENFAVWDEFGLPIPRSGYTPENIGETLKLCDCLPDLTNRIFKWDKDGGARS